MKVKIKLAKPKDREVVFRITKQAFQDYLDPAFSSQVPALQETKQDVYLEIKNKEVLIAYVDNQPAGSVRFYPLENADYQLSRLGVIDKFQGQQVGRKLIAEVESRVKEKGGRRIILYSAYQRSKLLKFYQFHGYKIKEITDNKDYKRAKLVKQLTDSS